LSSTFMDYLLPTSEEVPDIEVGHEITPSPATLLGTKGVGEGGAVGVSGCLLNAIQDALRPLEVDRVRETPLTTERVWQLIQDAKAKRRANV
ncbi:MAG: hypothetical protein ACE5JU_25135, partial [Candidatus Binatia bacterium]